MFSSTPPNETQNNGRSFYLCQFEDQFFRLCFYFSKIHEILENDFGSKINLNQAGAPLPVDFSAVYVSAEVVSQHESEAACLPRCRLTGNYHVLLVNLSEIFTYIRTLEEFVGKLILGL